MKLSEFAAQFSDRAGILQLMHDLGTALAGRDDVMMLGGGNPAHIPAMEARFAARMRAILDDPKDFRHMIGNYSPPQGDISFIAALARLLSDECGWDIGPEHIALTVGSQSAFFLLFNMFAGPYPDGTHRRILLPMVPEYIGYADLGRVEDFFVARKPIIDHLDMHTFKYRVDFEHLDAGADVGAICVSRPTNPTANVLTDDEVERLAVLARSLDVPLIIDAAYGLPFPGIVFVEAGSFWRPGIIACLSLSKLGLPGTRTGIVIADPPVISALAGMNAIFNLAPGNVGPALALDLVRSGEILRLGEECARPYYRSRVEHALEWLNSALRDLPYHVHRPEGAFFVWLWFPGMPMGSAVLYERLKRRGVVVVPGHHFFPGLSEEWEQRQQCIRLSYAQPPEVVERGIRILAEEVRAMYDTAAAAGGGSASAVSSPR